MNSERREQLKALADALERYPTYLGIRKAASELRRLAEVEQERDRLKAQVESLSKQLRNPFDVQNRHSGDCHFWSYKVCDCGYLMRANSHDFGTPSDEIVAQFLEHSRRIQQWGLRDYTAVRLAAYESAMQRERAPAWEKQLKELSTELRSASVYPAISDSWREDLQMASIKLFEMATVFTHKANFVPCELALNDAKTLLEKMNMTGGFGLDWHDRIRTALKTINATLQPHHEQRESTPDETNQTT